MRIIFRIIGESASGALRELRVNKLRTFLTLLGISIGIFCIISIFSAVDSLEGNLREGIDKLGSNVIYVMKFPWGPEGDDEEYPWWRYWNRPWVNSDEMKRVEENVNSASAVAISIWMNGTLKHEGKDVKNATINGVSLDYDKIFTLDFSDGRYFSPQENNAGDRKIIIGADVATELFGRQDNVVGQQVDFMGDALTVIGVFRKEGKSIVNTSFDNTAMIPYRYLTGKVQVDGMEIEPALLVKAKDNVSLDELKAELRGVMRSARRLPPKKEDNFAMNSISIISGQISSVFGVMDAVAWIIGGFAILVGGFGVANIMFVSVRERTNIIGIKKALGAKNYFILLEFLMESVILAVIGGIIGLIIVYLLLKVASGAVNFSLVLDARNIMMGILTSSAIGLIAGIVPAVMAARMDPVSAIRFK